MARTIEISEETYAKIKDQLTTEDVVKELNDIIGKKFLFRTVTYFLVGKVEREIGRGIFKLSDASWVADTGRFMNCIKESKLNEIEPVGTAFINLNSVVDFFPWKHKLPTRQK